MYENPATTITKIPPADISEAYRQMKTLAYDLTDTMSVEVREWRAELRAEYKRWVNGTHPEPDWQKFRDWLDEICRDDGMPQLFKEDTTIPEPLPM